MQVFRSYIATYLDAIEVTRYRELQELQPAPFASLAHGGAGTAYVLWRLGRAKQSLAWSKDALADRSYHAYAWEKYTFPVNAYMYGRTGTYWVRALVPGKTRGEAVAGFTKLARQRSQRELIGGTAGSLAGTSILLGQLDDPRVRATGEVLVQKLERTIKTQARTGWKPMDAVGLAHYWPGVFFALFAWMHETKTPAPAWLSKAARDLLKVWSPDVVRAKYLHASWCNGLAGASLLWAKAFEATGDEAFLAAARKAGKGLAKATHVGSDLCCGVGGMGYAALELDRIDPKRGWREQAVAWCKQAIAEPAFKWPNGIMRGHPGIVCLASDLEADQPRGFPTLSA